MKNSIPKTVIAMCILVVLAGSISGQQRKGKRQADCSGVDQETLAENVRKGLKGEPRLSGQNINVAVEKQVVTLTGNVSSMMKKRLAGNLAAKTACVVKVVNKLDVTPLIRAQEFECCCNGECWIQTRPCPLCGGVEDCIKDYQRAVKAADGNRALIAAAAQKFHECICKQ